jgi:hypothetical protein
LTGFSDEERAAMLDFSFSHWPEHSYLQRAQLALTLERAGRSQDARLVLDSVLGNALTDEDRGTYWAPEDRSWMWYNDTVEAHAFILRAVTELTPDDERRRGLVQWLFLNRHLGHWKSTRATAEVIYALLHHLKLEDALGKPELVKVDLGGDTRTLEFDPATYSGADNHIVVEAEEIDPRTMSTIEATYEGANLAFASATWHFSTEEPPAAAAGDLLGVTRRFFPPLPGWG